MTIDLTGLLTLGAVLVHIGITLQKTRDVERRVSRLEKHEEEGLASAARVWRIGSRFGQ